MNETRELIQIWRTEMVFEILLLLTTVIFLQLYSETKTWFTGTYRQPLPIKIVILGKPKDIESISGVGVKLTPYRIEIMTPTLHDAITMAKSLRNGRALFPSEENERFLSTITTSFHLMPEGRFLDRYFLSEFTNNGFPRKLANKLHAAIERKPYGQDQDVLDLLRKTLTESHT